MRTVSGWLPLLAVSLAACSADRSPTAPAPVEKVPGGVSSQIDIMTVGGTPVPNAIGRAINDSLLVVGIASKVSPDPSRAVIWAPPAYAGEYLPESPGIVFSEATDVSNDGTVVGVECAPTLGGCVPTMWRDGASIPAGRAKGSPSPGGWP
ncbi:MAG TPA: hypothetical protein VFR95_04150 [Gemmatimonadaceae bacterium]|nr:hypothetical protein [Gemmatimonadaceae bacterium]